MNEEKAQGAVLDEVYSLLSDAPDEKLGTLIEQRRDTLGISSRQTARVIGIKPRSLRRIVEGETDQIGGLTLLKISNFLQIERDHLFKAYVAGMRPEQIGDLEGSRVRTFLVNNFDLEGLRDIGFIESITDFEAIKERIETFFGLESVFGYNTDVAYPLYSKSKSPSRDQMIEFWKRSAYTQFERRPNPNEYNRDQLVNLVPQIHPYTRYKKSGFLTVARALYEIGVTVIGQKYLPFTQVRGATFVVNDKPCIVVTDYRKDYGTMWFALMHEIAHVLFDLDQIQNWSYHLSGGDDLMLIEDKADYFARELLFGEKKLDYISNLINNPRVVKRFARKHDVHPSLIYSFYAYRQYVEEGDKSGYKEFSSYMTSSEQALDPLRCHPWQSERVTDNIDRAIGELSSN